MPARERSPRRWRLVALLATAAGAFLLPAAVPAGVRREELR